MLVPGFGLSPSGKEADVDELMEAVGRRLPMPVTFTCPDPDCPTTRVYPIPVTPTHGPGTIWICGMCNGRWPRALFTLR
jgi:hypothetical protein